jgi:hypothetical protein
VSLLSFAGVWIALLAAMGGGTAAQEEPARIEGEGVVILHSPARRSLAIDFLNAWPEARDRVIAVTGGRLPELVRVDLVDSFAVIAAEVREATGTELPSWVAGVALPEEDRIVIRTDLDGPRGRRVRGILTHELSHLALAVRVRESGVDRLPRWLDEGVAQIAEGRLLVEEIPNLPMRAFFGRLIPLGELETHFPAAEGASALAYAQSESFVSFLTTRPGVDGPRAILDLLMEGLTLEEAVRRLTFLPLEEAEARWRFALRGDKSWVLGLLVQLGFGLFVLIAVVFGVPRLIRRRRAIEAEWDAEAAAGAGVEDREGEPAAEDSREAPAAESGGHYRRHKGRLPVRRLRSDEDEPKV